MNVSKISVLYIYIYIYIDNKYFHFRALDRLTGWTDDWEKKNIYIYIYALLFQKLYI